MAEERWVLSIALGGLLLAAGIVFLRVRRFLARAESREGEVVAVRAYSEQRTTRYIQVLRFELEGKRVQAELKAGLPYQVGARVLLFFEKANPTRVRVKAQLYRPVIVLLVFAGLAFLALVSTLRG
jgi:hypothetical protein